MNDRHACPHCGHEHVGRPRRFNDQPGSNREREMMERAEQRGPRFVVGPQVVSGDDGQPVERWIPTPQLD